MDYTPGDRLAGKPDEAGRTQGGKQAGMPGGTTA